MRVYFKLRTYVPTVFTCLRKGPNSPDLSGRLPILQPLSQSPDFTTTLLINEIVTYHFLVFCSFVELSFLCLSVFLLPHRRHLKCQSWSFDGGRPYVPRFSICCASQSHEFSFSPFVRRSKHSGIKAGKRSLFNPIYLLRKLGTKL